MAMPDLEAVPSGLLHYDEGAVAAMLAALRQCPQEKRMDSLAAVVKIFAQDECASRYGVNHG
jgi:hypothetical protein